uniref:Uncharacterized protein n=1 Tax=Arundo donax TaxID=35708 RepID=A0A0A8Z0Z0_ARUDO
MNCDYQGQT